MSPPPGSSSIPLALRSSTVDAQSGDGEDQRAGAAVAETTPEAAANVGQVQVRGRGGLSLR